MKPLLHPCLINDPFKDPGLYVEFLFERRALLFDLGEIHALPPRKLLRISDVFVSHAHMDHFAGFDHLLRLLLGRDKRLHLYGPTGFIDRVEHRLAAYTWNLTPGYTTNLVLTVTEAAGDGRAACAEFHSRHSFRREAERSFRIAGGCLLDEVHLRVRMAELDHDIPCLAFAVEETAHINVFKDRLGDLGIAVGPWLRDLKRAVLRGDPDDTPFRAIWRHEGQWVEAHVPLGAIKAHAMEIVPGQKIAYVVDIAYHEANAARVVALACDADMLFIETPFLSQDADMAARKRHLTAEQAGMLGRAAGVKRVVPFHFSPRYAGQGERLRAEALEAFNGSKAAHRPESHENGGTSTAGAGRVTT